MSVDDRSVQDTPEAARARRFDRALPGAPQIELAWTAAEATDIALIVRDTAGRIVFWNHAAQELYGFTAGDALGAVADDLLSTTFPRSAQAVAEDFRHAGFWDGTLLRRASDGRAVVVRSHWVARRTPDGDIEGSLEHDVLADPRDVAFDVVPGTDDEADRVYIQEPLRDPAGALIGARLLYTNDPVVLNAAGPGPVPEDLFPGFVDTPMFAVFAKVVATGRPVDFTDVRVQLPWGEEVVNAGRAIPFGDLVAVRARDVTVERARLQALDDAQARVRMALAVAPVAATQTDRDLTIRWGTGRIGRIDVGGLVGRRLGATIRATEDRRRFDEAVQRALRDGTDQRLELVADDDGRATPLDLLLHPLRGDDGEITGLISAAYDLTAQRRAQDALTESQETMRVVLDNVDAVMSLKDLEGRVLFVNRAGAEALGREPADLIGRTATEVFGEERGRVVDAADRAVLAAERPGRFEEDVVIAGRRHRVVTTRIPVFDRRGDPSGIATITVGVTDGARAVAEIAELQARLAAAEARLAEHGLA